MFCFCGADAGGVEGAVDKARRYVAINRLVSDTQRFSEHTRGRTGNDSQLWRRRPNSYLRVAVTRLYRMLFLSRCQRF